MGPKKNRKRPFSSAVVKSQTSQSPSVENNIRMDYEQAKGFFLKGNYNKALKIAEKSLLSLGESESTAILHRLQGTIFSKQAAETENASAKLKYLRRAVESAYRATCLSPNSLDFAHFLANSLSDLAELTRDPKDYERVAFECQRGLSLENPGNTSESGAGIENLKQELETLSRSCQFLIVAAEVGVKVDLRNKDMDDNPVDCDGQIVEQKLEGAESNTRVARELQRRAENKKKEKQKALEEKLKSFWSPLNVESKQKFMKLEIQKLKGYLKRLGINNEEEKALEDGLDFAKKNRKWKLWKCGFCQEEFPHCTVYKEHFKEEHSMKLETALLNVIPQKVDERSTKMLLNGDWKPVDIVAAMKMIKKRLGAKEEWVPANGWCKDWPLTSDKMRESSLNKIRKLFEFFEQRNCLSQSILEWVLDYTSGKLRLPGFQQEFVDRGMLQTPQCICFLEYKQLEEILGFLLSLAPNSSADEVFTLQSCWDDSGNMQRLNFNINFSCLLLGKRLLHQEFNALVEERSEVALAIDDSCNLELPNDGTIVSWLSEGPITKEELKEFLKALRKDNFDLWSSVFQQLESKTKHLETTCSKKLAILRYHEALLKFDLLYAKVSGSRLEIPDNEWQTYALTLRRKCEELVRGDGACISDTTRAMLTVVRDVLEGAESPNFGQLRCEDYSGCLSAIISKLDFVNDQSVHDSIKHLYLKIYNEIPLIDAKILMSADAKDQLEAKLVKLSAFDHRSIIMPLLKLFLREQLENDAKARSDAAHAALLAEIKCEEEKSRCKMEKILQKSVSLAVREKDDIEDIKATSGCTSQSVPLYQKATEHQPPVEFKCAKLPQQEEDCKLKVDNVKRKRNLEEQLENPRKIRNEFEELDVTEENKVDGDACLASVKGISSDLDDFTWKETQMTLTSPLLEGERTTDLTAGLHLKEIDQFALFGSPHREDAGEYNCTLDMIVKSLWHIKFFREELTSSQGSAHLHVEGPCVICVLQDLFSALSTEQTDAETCYCLLNTLRSCLNHNDAQENDAVELLMAIFKLLDSCKLPKKDGIANLLFGLEETEKMICYSCRREPRCPNLISYGFDIRANLLRETKSVIGDIAFEKLLKLAQMNYQMVCDPETGGCGKQNYVGWILSRLPFVFTLVLEWGTDETEEEIAATVTSLADEIDIGVLYAVTPLVKYKLVSMVARAEKEYSCMAYEKNKWIKHGDSVTEVIGDWEDVLGHCGKRKVRPEILFYEAM